VKVLVVDDEKALANSLKDNLEYEGYQVDCAYGGRRALDFLKADKYDLIVLDLMMPDLDGLAVLAALRQTGRQTPVLMLTARSAEIDKVKALGLGADDYVVKPFGLLELMARIKAILRRATPGSELQAFRVGESVVDLARLVIRKGGRVQELGRYEADILRLLASAPGKIFSRDEILKAVWGVAADQTNRTIDNYIVKLRQKIEPDPRNPQYLISVYRAGYKLIEVK
jgi:DNA-binding response OmpR family regulator